LYPCYISCEGMLWWQKSIFHVNGKFFLIPVQSSPKHVLLRQSQHQVEVRLVKL
jgi:hypothetical protein